ncbi:polysaccharide pyruvyl transferase family protein [Treponema succinifaciens]|uniref:Polysaccharide pyruvyl transferase domain-containing protein n=1 Tax=Treponema succinifaciens (strain ATCC 33096 / DSM 2489 / 6091) TaxID=869209 RepID=F2NRP6_TRES6|nr:polysaccharide pyruvyl transferase family protein [Treponema succinifaciens]AEB13864.1 hypothetical protein Tresu_0944 [Treponema succinifaciens DSM 2489]
MKTGIITFHDTTNYGANLQAYSLFKAVKNLGYECEIINYQCENIIKRELPFINIHGSVRNFIGSLVRYPKRAIKHFNLCRFIKSHERLSQKIYTRKNISEANSVYDNFIVGSDILWNLSISGNDFSYFLDFAGDNKGKFSYATSIGEPWTEKEKSEIKKWLSRFDEIAVREKEAVDWVNELSEKKANLVCDPTMLIEPEEWEHFTKKQKFGKYVLIYLPNEKCQADARNFARANNLKIVELKFYDSIEIFLSKIKYAEYIFTGSYHGFLFSLYFHTNIMFYNFQDTSRMRFLAEKFNIENHDATNILEIKEIPEINWDLVDRIREEFQDSSLDYLKGILKK